MGELGEARMRDALLFGELGHLLLVERDQRREERALVADHDRL